MKTPFVSANKWRIFPGDTGSLLKECMDANIAGFQGLAEKKDFAAVRRFRKGSENLFKHLDKEYSSLCHDENALVAWADRMRSVRKHLDELDRNLAFEGKRQFNWNDVVTLLAF